MVWGNWHMAPAPVVLLGRAVEAISMLQKGKFSFTRWC